jgi:hypothetical protein
MVSSGWFDSFGVRLGFFFVCVCEIVKTLFDTPDVCYLLKHDWTRQSKDSEKNSIGRERISKNDYSEYKAKFCHVMFLLIFTHVSKLAKNGKPF